MKSAVVFVIRYFFGAAASLYLFLAGFAFRRNRTLLSKICEHFGLRIRPVKPVLPSIELSNVFPRDVCVQIREPIAVDGNVSLLELFIIASIVNHRKPRVIFEIGTFDGRTTLNMAANSPTDAIVYTLDLPRNESDSTKLSTESAEKNYIRKDTSGSRFQSTDCANKIEQLFGDSAQFDFSGFNSRVDFIFIDGSHAYDYIINDSNQALNLLRDGKGVLVWHDYDSWRGVTEAINHLFQNDKRFNQLKHIRGTSLAYLDLAIAPNQN